MWFSFTAQKCIFRQRWAAIFRGKALINLVIHTQHQTTDRLKFLTINVNFVDHVAANKLVFTRTQSKGKWILVDYYSWCGQTNDSKWILMLLCVSWIRMHNFANMSYKDVIQRRNGICSQLAPQGPWKHHIPQPTFLKKCLKMFSPKGAFKLRWRTEQKDLRIMCPS